MSDAPHYKATAQVYLDRLYEPGEKITTFFGVPNRAMKPLNDAAEMACLERDEAKGPTPAPVSDRDAYVEELKVEVEQAQAERDEARKEAAASAEQVADLQALLTAAEQTIKEAADATSAAVAEAEAVKSELAAVKDEFEAYKVANQAQAQAADKAAGSRKGV